MKRIEDMGLGFAFFIFLCCFLFPTPILSATLAGKVAVEGPWGIKPRKILEERIKAERSVVVSKDGGVKNAVVFINGIKGINGDELLPKEVVIDQAKKTFIPHVLPIITGTKVTFKNTDSFVHRIIADSEAGKLRMEFAYEGATMNVTFDKPEIVELRCDDHKRMQGWIMVLETQFFAVTDEKGHFAIPNLPAGKYTVEVWHEVLGNRNYEIEVKNGRDIKVYFTLPGKEF